MEITILGSGTIVPDKNRNASCVVLKTSGLWIIVDLGSGTLRRLSEVQIDLRWIDLILITHFHPDHVSDLIPFLFASNYAYDNPRVDPFHVVGPRGLDAFYRGHVDVYGHWIVPTGNRLKIRELDTSAPDSFEIVEVTIRSMPAAHSFPSLSYRIEAESKSVTFSGDSDKSDKLVDLAKGTDILICEASFPDNMKVVGHLTPSEAGEIAEKAGAKKLVMTHFYPPCEGHDLISQAAKAFSGEIIKAKDFMRLEI